MCGLVTILALDGPVDESKVHRAVAALDHRGPDARGTWFAPDRTIGIGHTRLAVRGISSGAQPMHDGDLVTVVTGELYPYRPLRAKLEHDGHRFRTESDSELVLHLYRAHGLDLVHHLEGEFAFVLWDAKRRRLVAARDQFGIRPLCYSLTKRALTIASEGKALLAAGHPARWSRESFVHAAGLQYLPPDGTIFDGIHQLRPGHLLVVEEGGVDVRRYAVPAIDEPPPTLQDAIAVVRTTFDEAVRRRLDSEAPIAFGLSGGLDSSAIVATARTFLAKPPTCFSVSFDANSIHDESPIVRRFAAHHGLDLVDVPFGAADFVDTMEAATTACETFTVNAHAAAKSKLARAVRARGFKVLLTGEGADEFFLGYPHFKLDLGIEPSAHAASVTEGILMPHGPALDTSAFTRAFGFVPAFLRTKAGFGHRIASLLRPDVAAPLFDGTVYTDAVGRLDAGPHTDTPVLRSMGLWSQLSLPNYLMKIMGDGQEMAHAVEGRLPFLDPAVVRLARSLPVDWRIRDGVEKYVLREALRDRLTDELYRREKHPFFAPPIDFVHDTHVRNFVNDLLRSDSFRAAPFFDPNRVAAWIDEVRTPSPRTDATLCFLLSTAILAERFRLR